MDSKIDARRALTRSQRLRAAERAATLARVAASIAHELGTSLNVVSGRASMIADDAEADSDTRRNAEIIIAQAADITKRIQTLLDFARIRPGQRRKAHVADLVPDFLDVVHPLATDRQLELEVDVDDRVDAPVAADHFVLLGANLVVRAINASAPTDVIRVELRCERVQQPPDRRCSPGNYVCLAVHDTGTAAVTNPRRLGNPFFAAERDDADDGLALAVCYEIARQHDGWLEVHNFEHGGTVTRAYLNTDERCP